MVCTYCFFVWTVLDEEVAYLPKGQAPLTVWFIVMGIPSFGTFGPDYYYATITEIL